MALNCPCRGALFSAGLFSVSPHSIPRVFLSAGSNESPGIFYDFKGGLRKG
jgi:hypothetical protein